jgi:two-component system response regulator CpxR
MVTDCLKPEEFEATSVHDGHGGLEAAFAEEARFDLILLATLLPDAKGLDLLQRIRSRLDTPVILLADPSQKEFRVAGIELGADDFLVKPCNPCELRARVGAILRRTKNYLKTRGRIVLGDVELDSASRIVRRNGETLHLTTAEFNLLEILLRAAGQIVSREQLALSVLGHELGAYDRSVDMLISRLRKKLGHRYNGIERIITIRGIGFVYAIPNPFQ